MVIVVVWSRRWWNNSCGTCRGLEQSDINFETPYRRSVASDLIPPGTKKLVQGDFGQRVSQLLINANQPDRTVIIYMHRHHPLIHLRVHFHSFDGVCQRGLDDNRTLVLPCSACRLDFFRDD